MVKSWFMGVAVLAVTAGAAVAQTASSGMAAAPSALGMAAAPPALGVAPSSVTTSRGPGLVTGTPGLPQTIMIPGSAVPGMLLDNGNGTSSVMVPGGPSQLIPTPR